MNIKSNHKVSEQVLLGEVQLLLAEKRTYFAILRTGLAIIAVPLTIIAFLTATAGFHKIFEYFWLGGVVIVILLAISGGGVYLSYKAVKKIKRIDDYVRTVEKMNKRIDEIVV